MDNTGDNMSENMSENMNESIARPNSLSDGCPDWAHEIISRILILEVEVGTIKSPSESATSTDWSTENLDKLAKLANRMDNSGTDSTSETVEAMFIKVAQGLTREGHTADVIAAMVNARIPTGCRLPYCSPAEVADALN